jgi:hypothetical protein
MAMVAILVLLRVLALSITLIYSKWRKRPIASASVAC